MRWTRVNRIRQFLSELVRPARPIFVLSNLREAKVVGIRRDLRML